MSTYIAIPQTRNRKLVQCHLLGDTREELDAMAEKVGAGPEKFRGGAEPYYILRIGQSRRARELGAREASLRHMAERLLQRRNERLAKKKAETHEPATETTARVCAGDRFKEEFIRAALGPRVGAGTSSRSSQ